MKLLADMVRHERTTRRSALLLFRHIASNGFAPIAPPQFSWGRSALQQTCGCLAAPPSYGLLLALFGSFVSLRLLMNSASSDLNSSREEISMSKAT